MVVGEGEVSDEDGEGSVELRGDEIREEEIRGDVDGEVRG